MSMSAIAGAAILLLSVMVLGAGFASGNMYLSNGAGPAIDTGRRSAPVAFWAATVFWSGLALFGIALIVVG
ncbi:hypothetical protein [Sphingomonas elodea]|uniref:hypothetical protein n=1 Tax=Sphingomonas elodea TaxID=179878 RepID=UPI001300C2CF|nr:hypothetical protein [Sphingomonas elodea]